jgi:hypothetical protein
MTNDKGFIEEITNRVTELKNMGVRFNRVVDIIESEYAILFQNEEELLYFVRNIYFEVLNYEI